MLRPIDFCARCHTPAASLVYQTAGLFAGIDSFNLRKQDK